ncbi:MAG: hypothetical protein OET41_00285 [Xanthomonadales bacterium]|nr:hypothetical protein [Xanthomonadales bacterium]
MKLETAWRFNLVKVLPRMTPVRLPASETARGGVPWPTTAANPGTRFWHFPEIVCCRIAGLRQAHQWVY